MTAVTLFPLVRGVTMCEQCRAERARQPKTKVFLEGPNGSVLADTYTSCLMVCIPATDDEISEAIPEAIGQSKPDGSDGFLFVLHGSIGEMQQMVAMAVVAAHQRGWLADVKALIQSGALKTGAGSFKLVEDGPPTEVM